MDTVPTLCATSTVGVAALGYSFGRETQSATARPGSNKRKAGGETPFGDNVQPPIASANTTSLGNLTTPRFQHHGATLAQSSQPVANVPTATEPPPRCIAEHTLSDDNEEAKHPDDASLARHPETRDRPISSEYRGNSINRSSSWLKRLSTLSSSSRNESPNPSSRSGSPSMSFSNGSIAPILPHANSSPAVLSPNKLVKRTSSQRGLHGSGTSQSPSSRPQFPSLRRPATSHQRSATLRRQYPQDDKTEFIAPPKQPPALRSSPISSSSRPSTMTGHWQPHFRRKPINTTGEGPPTKRNTAGVPHQNDIIRRINPDVDQLPTLLMATSISQKPYEEVVCNDQHDLLVSTGPTTPSDIRSSFASSANASETDRRPRRSFSISDMLSSRTPSSWKGPQSRRDRKKGHRSSASAGTRVVSAPQSSMVRQPTHSDQADIRSPPSRRTMTDPSIFYNTSTDVRSMDSPELPLPGLNTTPVLPLPLYSPSTFEIDFRNGVRSYPSTSHSDSPSTSSYITSAPPSSPPVPVLVMNRPQRYSVGPSDRASTLVGSDNDARGVLDEEEMDFQSETVFDSLRTGATGSSNSGTRGPRIETIFDESPPPDIRKPKLVELQELLRDGSFSTNQVTTSGKHRILEEDEGLSTPVRADASHQDDDFPTPVTTQVDRLVRPEISASPAEVPSSLSLGKLEWDCNDLSRTTGQWAYEGEDEEDWDSHEEGATTHNQREGPLASSGLGFGTAKIFSTSPISSPLHSNDKPDARDTRTNIFDWSEQHATEKDGLQGSSPRPSTVHGKQGADSRGSRATGRPSPHAVHLRSQSVPVTPDTSAHRDHGNLLAKLGPWGLGNKGVSEDWNDDFEFDEPTGRNVQGESGREAGFISEGVPNFVPKAILERQASVHGQFGQVREFALMVEELKRLRTQASSLGIIEGPSVELWKEAEGIINLATQDDEEQEYSPPQSPSSPRSNRDPFEDDSTTYQIRRKFRQSPTQEHVTGKGSSHDLDSTAFKVEAGSKYTTPPPMRPRKESSAKAKSVLETINQQRGNSDPLMTDVESRAQKKLPFDTTSLRDLVIRAGVVTRAVKEIVRRAENTPQAQFRQLSPPPDPLFSQIFAQPIDEPSSGANGTISKSKSSKGFHSGSGPITGNENEINGHMKLMAVV